jgi:hypothetical protein
MGLKEEITAAIGAHSAWKARLQTAIKTGTVDVKVEDVCKDNMCAFGKWMYGPTITPAVKSSADYTACRSLHADFHKSACKVLELVTQGKKQDAEAMLGFDGDYTKKSATLSAAMMKWQKTSGV